MIPRIEIRNHVAFGELVAKWSQDPASRPHDLAELKRQCADILTIPDRIQKIAWVDVPLDTFVIRVPNKDMVAESVARFTAQGGSKGYPSPAFYEMIGAHHGPSALEVLYSRIADYTVAQCA